MMNEYKALIEKIDDIAEECKNKGWDGHEGIPITDLKPAKEFAKKLCWSSRQLARKVDVVPCGHGTIDFDWHDDNTNEMMGISVEPDKYIYNYRFKKEKGSGETYRTFILFMLLKEKKWPDPPLEIHKDFKGPDYKECYKVTKANATQIKEWLETTVMPTIKEAKLYWYASRDNMDDPVKHTDNEICFRIDDGKKGGKYIGITTDSKTLKVFSHNFIRGGAVPTLDIPLYLSKAFFRKLEEIIKERWNKPLTKV